jgi:hypothetical protein
MLVGSKCIIHTCSGHSDDGSSGVIACEPQLCQESLDFWVLVLIDGALNRVDTDYIEMLDK